MEDEYTQECKLLGTVEIKTQLRRTTTEERRLYASQSRNSLLKYMRDGRIDTTTALGAPTPVNEKCILTITDEYIHITINNRLFSQHRLLEISFFDGMMDEFGSHLVYIGRCELQSKRISIVVNIYSSQQLLSLIENYKSFRKTRTEKNIKPANENQKPEMAQKFCEALREFQLNRGAQINNNVLDNGKINDLYPSQHLKFVSKHNDESVTFQMKDGNENMLRSSDPTGSIQSTKNDDRSSLPLAFNIRNSSSPLVQRKPFHDETQPDLLPRSSVSEPTPRSIQSPLISPRPDVSGPSPQNIQSLPISPRLNMSGPTPPIQSPLILPRPDVSGPSVRNIQSPLISQRPDVSVPTQQNSQTHPVILPRPDNFSRFDECKSEEKILSIPSEHIYDKDIAGYDDPDKDIAGYDNSDEDITLQTFNSMHRMSIVEDYVLSSQEYIQNDKYYHNFQLSGVDQESLYYSYDETIVYATEPSVHLKTITEDNCGKNTRLSILQEDELQYINVLSSLYNEIHTQCLSPQLNHLTQAIESIHGIHSNIYNNLIASPTSITESFRYFISIESDLHIYAKFIADIPSVDKLIKREIHDSIESLNYLRKIRMRLLYYSQTIEVLLKETKNDEDKNILIQVFEILRNINKKGDSALLIENIKEPPFDLTPYEPLLRHSIFTVACSNGMIRKGNYRLMLFNQIILICKDEIQFYEFIHCIRLEQTFITNGITDPFITLQVKIGGNQKPVIFTLTGRDHNTKSIWEKEITKMIKDLANKVKKLKDNRFIKQY